MFLPIITSRELLNTRLATYEMWLVYLQKITNHNEPFMPGLMKAFIYITVHYRNGIHALSRCMDSVQPRTPPLEWSVFLPGIFDMRNAHV
jgi:hypothetical protein